MEYKIEDFKHGRPFKAKIEGVDCEGKLSVDKCGDIYLCQNQRTGSEADYLFEYRCSWICYNAESSDDIETQLTKFGVTDFRFTDEDEAPSKNVEPDFLKALKSGKKARFGTVSTTFSFVAHVPHAVEFSRVVLLNDETGHIRTCSETGTDDEDSRSPKFSIIPDAVTFNIFAVYDEYDGRQYAADGYVSKEDADKATKPVSDSYEFIKQVTIEL